MKKVIDYLYYQPISDQATTVPQGDINIKKLIQNNDNFWESPFNQTDKLKKTLIFSNWIAFNDDMRSALKSLIRNGFTIYYKDNYDNYQLMTQQDLSSNVHLLSNKKPFDYMPKSRVAEGFLSLHPNLTRDQIEILDYRLMSNLIDDPNKILPEVKSIYLSDLNNTFLTGNGALLSALPLDITPSMIQSIVHEIKEFKNAKLVIDYFVPNWSSIEDRILHRLSEFGYKIPVEHKYKMVDSNGALELEDFTACQTVLVDQTISSDKLKQILTQSRGLKNILFSVNCRKFNLHEIDPIESVETLEINHNIDIDLASVATLLRLFPNICNLILRNTTIDIASDILLPQTEGILPCSQLKTLILDGVKADDCVFQALLRSAPHLEKFQSLGSNFAFHTNSDTAVLTKLTDIEIYGDHENDPRISLDVVSKIAPNLQKLTLPWQSEVVSNATRYENLSELDIRYQHIADSADNSSVVLSSISHAVPNLSTLSMDMSKIVPGSITSCPKANKLKIHSLKSAQDLDCILQSNPDIEELFLQDPQILDSIKITTSLSHLRSIIIVSGNINATTLTSLVTASQDNLQELILSSRNITHLNSLPEIPTLHNLVTLHADANDANRYIKGLLHACPHLKTLKLTGDLSKDEGLEIRSNAELETLIIDTNRIELYGTFISSAKHLKSLIIRSQNSASSGDISNINWQNLCELKTLEMYDSYLPGNVWSDITKYCVNLQRLVIFRSKIYGLEDCKLEHTLDALKILNLSTCEVQSDAFSAVIQCAPNLINIDVSVYNTPVDPSRLMSITTLSKLQVLSVSGIKGDSAFFKQLLESCPDLYKCSVGWNGVDPDSLIQHDILHKLELLGMYFDSDSRVQSFPYLNLLHQTSDVSSVDALSASERSLLDNIRLAMHEKNFNTGIFDQASQRALKQFLKSCAGLNIDQIIDLSEKVLQPIMPSIRSTGTTPTTNTATDISIDNYGSSRAIDFTSSDSSSAALPTTAIVNLTLDFTNDTLFDADTKDHADSELLSGSEIFTTLDGKPYNRVAMHHARMGVFTKLKLTDKAVDLNHAITLSHAEHNFESRVVPNSLVIDLNDQENYAKANLTSFAISPKYKPIPSLSSKEEIVAFNSSDEIEVVYDQNENIHYVRSVDGRTKNVSLEYILRLPKNIEQEFVHQDREVAELVRKYNTFGSGALHSTSDTLTSAEWLDAIINQQVGACRHRAVAFKYEMDQFHRDYETRVVQNGLHAFCEYKKKGQHTWTSCDLGGYETTIEVAPQTAADSKDKLMHVVPATSNEPIIFGAGASDTQRVSSNDDTNHDYIPPEQKVVTTKSTKALDIIIRSGEEGEDIDPCDFYDTNALEQLTQFITEQKHTLYQIQSAQVKVSNCSEVLEKSVGTKRLVLLSGEQELINMKLQIAQHSLKNAQEIFFVDSADDLICSLPFIQRNADDINHGRVVSDRKGGALFDFLRKPCTKPKVLIVDYSKFSVSEIVKYNSILDETRTVENVEIPENLVIYGLSNTSDMDHYDGWDFYRRFDGHIYEVSNVEKLETKRQILREQLIDPATPSINLYQGSDWKNILLGKWIVGPEGLLYIKGELVRVLETGAQKFHIKNGPWQDLEFKEFWDCAFALGFIRYEGMRIDLPTKFDLSTSEGYEFEVLSDSRVIIGSCDDAETISPTYAYLLFDGYRLQDNCKMTITNGMIHAHEGKTLNINLTRGLSKHTWARILDECKKYNVCLNVYAQDESLVPSWYKDTPVTQATNDARQRDKVIEHTDIDLAATAQEADIVIDISEARITDLIGTIEGKFNTTTHAIEFTRKDGFLTTQLAAGKKVALVGHLGDESKDALSKFLFDRQHLAHKTFGELVVVSDDVSNIYGAHIQHITSEELYADKQSLLDQELTNATISLDTLMEHNIATLLAKAHLGAETFKGFDQIQSGIKQDISYINFDSSAQDTTVFETHRMQQVENILQKNPYVFLSGLTGVGKTAFVQDFAKTKNVQLYYGMKSIKEWARDTSDKQKILFIDEANLQQRDFTEFEGMFWQETPGESTIFIDSELVPLNNTQHKVIFAGNPTNYGNGRTTASLFKKHGGAVVFDVLPMYFIYEKALKNMFVEHKNLELGISQAIGEVYKFFVEISQDSLSISPRELTQIALLSLTKLCKDATTTYDHIQSTVFDIAYRYYKTLVPKNFQAQYKRKFDLSADSHTTNEDIECITYGADKAFYIVGSRKAIANKMEELLDLRQFKKSSHEDAIIKAGQGGIILEGKPGIGKSEIIRAIFAKHHLEEQKDWVQLPTNLKKEVKCSALIKAFHAGQIVVIDEFNTSYIEEALLNNLLMGVDSEGRNAESPGFMIFATQNPSTMQGRCKESAAILTRMQKEYLTAHTQEEQNYITQHLLVHESVPPGIVYNNFDVADFLDVIGRAEENLHD